jgi:hypothetical protein
MPLSSNSSTPKKKKKRKKNYKFKICGDSKTVILSTTDAMSFQTWIKAGNSAFL